MSQKPEFVKKTLIDPKGENIYTFKNLRNFRYNQSSLLSCEFVTRNVDADNLEKVYFVYEKFGNLPLVSHTFLIFDFGEVKLALSVEANVPAGQRYSLFKGLFRVYPLHYCWSYAQDAIDKRVLLQGHNLEYYQINDVNKQEFLEGMIKRTNFVNQSDQKYYNTLFCNCTTEIVESLLPKSWHRIFAGHLARNTLLNKNLIIKTKYEN